MDAAARAAASGSPKTVQAQYDAARDFQEALDRALPVSRGCAELQARATQFAAGQVLAAEGVDRLSDGVRRRGTVLADQAKARLARLPRRCTAGPLTRPAPRTGAEDRLRLPPSAANAVPPVRRDAALAAQLATVGGRFRGYAAIWVHNLATGRFASWNANARFPAASTVKLAVLVAALRRFGPRPERSSAAHDLRSLAGWSSNLAANRLFAKLGRTEIEATLRRLGAASSTYPGPYRVGTGRHATAPPLVSGRVTTARDLAAVLLALHRAALGKPDALRRTGLSRHQAQIGLSFLLASEAVGDNLGLLRPWLPPGYKLAQKNGWLNDARHTAAIVFAPAGPRIVVLLTYRPGLERAVAAELGRRVLALALAGP